MFAGDPAGSYACKSILVVEDDEGIRGTLQFFLEFEGYKVFTAINGRNGIDLLPNIPRPCLILLDLMMPIMDGGQFIEVIGKDRRFSEIPIVVVTAFSDKAKTIRANGIVNKPVDLSRLLEVVKEYCG